MRRTLALLVPRRWRSFVALCLVGLLAAAAEPSPERFRAISTILVIVFLAVWLLEDHAR